MCTLITGGMAQWAAYLTHNVKNVGSSSVKTPSCFLEQETLPLLLITCIDWFQEWIRV